MILKYREEEKCALCPSTFYLLGFFGFVLLQGFVFAYW